MFFLSFHLVFCLGLIIFKTGALVTLTTENALMGKNSFGCGDTEVLICTIDPVSNAMAWTKNTSTAQLASCTPLMCITNPSFASEYTFKFNRSSGIFEMTIANVTLPDQGTTYFCDDGVNSDSLTIDVIVNEDCNATISYQEIDSNTTEVRATTGCIRNSTAQKVAFKWWFQEVNDTTGEKSYLETSDSKEGYDDSACKADTDCWTDGFTQKTRSLNISEEETGKLYNVGVNVTFGSGEGNSVLLDNKTFMINLPVKDTVPPIPPCPCCIIGIVIAYLIIWIVQLQMCIYGYSQGSSYLFHGYMKWFVVLQLFTHVPLLGLTPAIYIYRPIPISDRRYITWYTIFASAPILGIFVKVALAWRKKKTDHQNFWKVFLFVAMGMASMVVEIFVILLCVIWCISQCYYPFIIALCDLMTRWVLFIIIAVLYHADIKETNTHREDVPSPLAFGIALWCTPIIGSVFNIYWKHRQEPVRCLSDGHRVAPEDKMKSPRKEIMPREETHKRRSKQVASLPKGKNDKTTPRALPKIPRVRSSNMLPEQATEIHTKLPPIQYRKM